MRQKHNLKLLAEEWFDKAREDLEVAKHLHHERVFPSPICFHAHQAVEKFFKGFLILHGKDIRDEFKTHDLKKLFEYARSVDKELSNELLEYCLVLNRYYITARYPADMPEYPWKDVTEAVRAAEATQEVIEKFI